MSGPPNPLHLGVARDEFEQALRMLRRTVPKRSSMPEALLTYDEGDLIVSIGGAEVRAAAWGRWTGVVRTAGQVMTSLDRFLPDNDPMPVHVEDGRLTIGRTSVPCAWQETVPESMRVPVDPGLLHLLRLPLERDPVSIEEAGLSELVEWAVDRRDELLERAAVVLSPLEIGIREIERCLEARMREKFEGGDAADD